MVVFLSSVAIQYLKKLWTNGTSPLQPGKFAKDWEQSTFQTAMKIDSRNNFNLLV